MKASEINIRDPFVLCKNEKYYIYGTRANSFGKHTGGFDVYISNDLKEWSEPVECFSSEKYNLNKEVNWAPEVHKYKGSYIMLATFTKENGLRGTYALIADSPDGEFTPYSDGALTPCEWECLDGILYIDKKRQAAPCVLPRTYAN
ncbi:MAG: family 43 glycosylhydrolase [Clostridiales bacterium]|nr:family 43 glycosylhydrolase [Clostridiales bacterium]